MGEREQGEVWIFGASHVNHDSPPEEMPTDRLRAGSGVERTPVVEQSDTPGSRVEQPNHAAPAQAAEPQARNQMPPPSTPQWVTTPQAGDEAVPASPPKGRRTPGSRKAPLLVAAGLALVLATAGTTMAVLRHGDVDGAQAVVPAASSTSLQPSAGPSSYTDGDGAAGTADGDASTSAYPTDEPSESPTSSPSASDSDSPSKEAKAQLEQLADEGLNEVSLDGQHVAMVASKWNGVRDPLQETADGSHVFHYADILAEHERLKSEDNYGADLVLLRSTDYGKRRKSPNGKVMYVTFAIGSFGSQDEVEDWCKERFADLSKAERANNCVPTRLTD